MCISLNNVSIYMFNIIMLNCICVLVAQSCPTLCDPMDCSPPGSTVHGILQARILEWVAIPFSRGSSWPRNQSWVSFIAGGFLTVWATREAWGFKQRRKHIQAFWILVYTLSGCFFSVLQSCQAEPSFLNTSLPPLHLPIKEWALNNYL